METAEICLRHRVELAGLYEGLFGSGGDVLYVSIMSSTTLPAMRERLERARTSGTSIRVLTWHPEVPDEVISAAWRHFGKKEQRSCCQVQEAATAWKKLSDSYKDVLTVRYYRSVPTMQGRVVSGTSEDYVLLEILSYRTLTADRAALIVKPDSPAFQLFRNAFEELWQDATPPS